MSMLADFLCPSCPTADRVRCIVLGDGFFTNLGIAALPFAVVLLVTIAAHRWEAS